MTEAHHENATVVVLPGLWMPAWVMLPLAWRLRGLGHRAVRFGYRSANDALKRNAEILAACIRRLEVHRVHLVGHSLGGVLALHTVAHFKLTNVHRIVMAGSPYRDSYTARRLGEHEWGRRMLGRTVADWLACEKPCAPPGVEVGVIAGTRPFGLGRLVTSTLEKPHDGVIRVAETAVPGMTAYGEVRVSHAGMVLSAQVARLIDAFLRHGEFFGTRSSATPSEPCVELQNRKRS